MNRHDRVGGAGASRPSPETPRISVVIPCFNLGRYLDEAVESILRQTLRETEVIVVDDGSTDEETVRLLAGYRKPRTTVLRGPNRGLPAARNLGIARARAPLVLCLDADDLLEPPCLERAARELDADGTVSIAGFWHRAFGAGEWDCTPAACALHDILVENRICCCAMFRRSMWEEIGGYDEGFTKGYEDWEFWIRALGRGHRVRIIPEFLYRYRIREGSMLRGSDLPGNRAVIMRALIGKHAALFRENLVPALAGREKIIEELICYLRQQGEAKRWFLARDGEHGRYIARIEGDMRRLGLEVGGINDALARRNEALRRREEECARQRRVIGETERELRAVYGSRAWRLGCAFRDAKRSWKGLAALPAETARAVFGRTAE